MSFNLAPVWNPNNGYYPYPAYNQPILNPMPAPSQTAAPAQNTFPTNNPQTTLQVIPGKWINDEKEITAGDVPMDGNVYFFPKRDYSYIVAKIWDQNGKLQMFRFVPEHDSPTLSTSSTDISAIMAKLDSIEKKVSYKHYNKPKPKNQNGRKEESK